MQVDPFYLHFGIFSQLFYHFLRNNLLNEKLTPLRTKPPWLDV